MALHFMHNALINMNYPSHSVNGLVAVIPTHWTVASVKSASLLSLWDITSPNVKKKIIFLSFITILALWPWIFTKAIFFSEYNGSTFL